MNRLPTVVDLALRAIALVAALAIVAALTGFGGGEDLEDPTPTPPVPCSVDRKACI